MTATLAAQRVSRAFRGGAGIHDVTLTVEPGQIHALIGLNGAGKSTLLRVLLGMLRPDSGQVLLEGVPLSATSAAAWSAVGHLIDGPLAYDDLTVEVNLALAARLHGIDRASVDAVVSRSMVELDIARYARVRSSRLSQGNRQRLGLAAAMAHDPRLIVLDEPSNALDPAGMLALRESLRRRAAAGAGVLVSSHHLDEVARIADRVTLMNAGRVIGELDPRAERIEREFFERLLADDRARGAA